MTHSAFEIIVDHKTFDVYTYDHNLSIAFVKLISHESNKPYKLMNQIFKMNKYIWEEIEGFISYEEAYQEYLKRLNDFE